MTEYCKPLVSVIVPVYNVRPYISEALESLSAQTYGQLEILLVDDGSDDGSGEVCDRYVARDSRFHVIHQENRGLSAARNAGLDRVTGDVIAFLDADDAFHPDMIRRLLEAMLRESADVAVCSICNVFSLSNRRQRPTSSRNSRKTDRILSREAALRALADQKIHKCVWNKLYARKLWNELRFPEGHVYEDFDTTFRIFDRIDRCCVLEDVLVYHRIRSGSITQSPTVDSLEDRYIAQCHFLAYVQSHSPAVFSQAQAERMRYARLNALLQNYGTMIMIGADDATLACWRQRIAHAAQDVSIRRCCQKVRVAYALARRSPKLYGAIYTLYAWARRVIYRALRK